MERRVIAVHGVVQGVGFRPFVFGLASRLHLAGFVQNRVGGVWIEVEGDECALDSFLHELSDHPPPLARIEHLAWEPRDPCGASEFQIEPSESCASGIVFVSPDVATCQECFKELRDPRNRRYRYPFLNCINCGPRLTIITGAPYDRSRTTMADFMMCGACQAEYQDPANRRFHAQPTCCSMCGPQLRLIDPSRGSYHGDEALEAFAKSLLAGRIGALKGLGGYHLCCDARTDKVAARLRDVKQRDEKPFALMMRNIDAVTRWCEVSRAERELLQSPRRPIVLLRKNPLTHGLNDGSPRVPGVENPCLGVMLPYSPLHHLLFDYLGDVPLIMTSGNRHDEPMAYEDADAFERLMSIADVMLTHDRPIHQRCDDSVMRVLDDGAEMPIRRSRGYAPESIPLPMDCPMPLLAVGGQLKNTFALGQGGFAFLSHHLGDLDQFDALQAFQKDLDLFEDLFAIRPAGIVHDLHPDYVSTRYALERAEREGLKFLGVQHHHAHIASCLAEHGLDEPAIGVAFDGSGYGTDGAVWGGEFLVADLDYFRRVAHLRYVGMPGGEQAIREPWRMAQAHLLDALGEDGALADRVSPEVLRVSRQMLESGFNTPSTSSMGRLFDAVACLLGLRDRVSYEGQAAIELEWLAYGDDDDTPYPWSYDEDKPGSLVIDTRPTIRAVAREVRDRQSRACVARRFHATVAEMIVGVCRWLRGETGIDLVALSGGVFLNVLLSDTAQAKLMAQGFRVLRHRRVPPGDGGISLGQLAIGARLLAETRA